MLHLSMASSVLKSILRSSAKVTVSETHHHVSYNCLQTPPFFEGHRHFLEPVSRSVCGGLVTAVFERQVGRVEVVQPHLQELIELFSFLEESGLAFKEANNENFGLQGGHLVIAKPWALRNDLEGSELKKNQEEVMSVLKFVKLSEAEKDCLNQFWKGMSPQRIKQHPVFWSMDRMKCFLIDLADSRKALSRHANHPRLSENWINFVGQSALGGFLKSQKEAYAKRGNMTIYDEERNDIVECIIFTANLVRCLIFIV